MTQDLPPIAVHPTGEQFTVALGGAAAAAQPLVVDSFAGSVRVEWDHATAFTPLGQLPFFIDFLKTAGLFSNSFFADSPLTYESPNASKTRDVLGTAMLSMLAGHKRYSHIAALRGDGVLPELLGMREDLAAATRCGAPSRRSRRRRARRGCGDISTIAWSRF